MNWNDVFTMTACFSLGNAVVQYGMEHYFGKHDYWKATVLSFLYIPIVFGLFCLTQALFNGFK